MKPHNISTLRNSQKTERSSKGPVKSRNAERSICAALIVSGLVVTSVPSGAVPYHPAIANTITTPVTLTNVHVGGTFGTQALSLTNTAVNDGLAEKLDASFGATTGQVSTNAGSINLLAAQSTNNTSMVVGLGGAANTAVAGAKTGTVVVTLNSDGTGTSGAGLTPLASQTITVNGGVYNLAAANTITTPISLANVRVGGSFGTQTLIIQNVAAAGAFSEKLDASFGANGGLATNNAGTINLLAAQSTDATSMVVGLGGAANTAVAGSKTGTVTVILASDGTGTSGLGTSALTAQTLNVTGNVFRLAAANTITTPISLGNVHVGASFGTQALTIQNTATNDGFSEKLDASFGANGGLATNNAGAFTLLAAQSTNNSALTVGLGGAANTAVAGAKSGTVTVNLTSDGTGTSGLANFALSAQTLTVTGNVYRLAVANTISTPISLGNVHVGASFGTQALSIQNTAANDGFSEKLDGSFGANGGLATNNAGSIGLLAAGSTDNTSLTVGLGGGANTATAGAKSGTVTVNLTSDGAGTSGLGTSALTAQTLNVTGNVFRLAAANTITTPISLGNVHVGASFGTQALTIQNTAANDGFSEKLDSSFGANGGLASNNSGAINLLAPQGIDNSTMTVGLGGNANTATAGTKAGTVTVDLTSDGNGTSGLGTSALTAQTLNVTGNVFNYAAASAIATPVNLGFVHVGGSFGTHALSVQNTAANGGFSEKLDAGFGANGGLATNNAGSISLLAPQSIDGASLVVGLGGNANTATAGVKNGTVQVNLTSDGLGTSGLGTTSLTPQIISVTGGVFSGKAEWNSAVSGNWLPDTNWKDTQSAALGGAPGLAGVIGDTATFGTVPVAGTVTVNLNGNSPVLTSVNFNNSAASYVLANGGGGTVILQNPAGVAITGTVGNHTISAPVSLRNNVTANVAAGSVTLSGIVDDNGTAATFTKTGDGTVTLTGANTYTGLTDVQAGTLVLNTTGAPAIMGNLKVSGGIVQVDQNNEIQNTGSVTVTAGTLALGASTDNTVAGVSLQGGAITGNAALASASDFDLQNGTASAVLNGPVALVKTTGGTVILGNANTFNSYSGGTQVNGGLLQITGLGTLGAVTGSLAVTGATSILDLGTTTQTVGTVTLDNGGTVRNGSLVGSSYSSTGGGTVSANLGGTGDLTLNSGILELLGANTYAGATIINGGKLVIGNGTSGSINGASLVQVMGGELELNLAGNPAVMNRIANEGVVTNKSLGTVSLNNEVYGHGSLVQNSPGTLILNTQDHYTGATQVTAGTLIAGVSNALPQFSSVSVASGATLVLSTAGNQRTQSIGSLSGAGTVSFDSVTLTLGFDNTSQHFSGTFLGTPNSVSYDSTADWFIDSATVPFNANILSTGLVIVRSTPHGAGLSSLSNFNLGAPSGGGSGTVFSTISGLTNAGYTISSSRRHFTVDSTGEVRGAILLNQGVVDIQAGGNVDGHLTLTGGEGIVNGTVGRGTIIDGSFTGVFGAYVGQQAYLHGNGTISGNLVNAGTLSPGNSPGTLTVNGNFVQSSSGTLLEEIQSRTVYDRLIVKGSAKLDGSVRISQLGNFRAQAGDTFTILTAGGGVSGKFNLVNPYDTGTILELGLVYQSNQVLLSFVQGSFAGLDSKFTLTPNQKAVAGGLDNLAANQPKSALITTLDSLQLAALPGQLTALSPAGLTSIFTAGVATESVQSSNIQRRLEDLRNGVTGFSSSGACLTDSHGSMNFDGLPLFGAEVTSEQVKFTEVKPGEAKGTIIDKAGDNRWGTFLAGSGEFTKLGGDNNVKGSDFTTGGVTLGLDYRVCNNFAVGAMAGFANTTSGEVASGKVDINGGKGGLYSTWFKDGYYVDSSFTVGSNSYDTSRSTLGGTAKGSTTGLNWNALIGGGFDRKVGKWAYGPIASVQYTHVGLDQFTETGSLAPLTFLSQSQDSLRTQAGVHASYVFKLGNQVYLTPDVRVQWQHEFMDSTASLASRFAGETTSFTVNGAALKRDSLSIDAGATLIVSPTVSIFAYYIGDVGRSNYSSNAVSGGLRINF